MSEERDGLGQIRDCLRSHRELKVKEKGSGRAAFLYVRSARRAAEVSVDNGGFFVEYWGNTDEESYEPPVRSETVESIPEVVKRLLEFL